MRLRILAAVLAAVLACVGLTACQTAAGAAVTIDGQRYTENDVQGYLTPAAQPVSLQQGSVSPKAFVVDQLIIDQLLVKVIGALPGGPTPTQVDAELAKESAGKSYTQQAEALGLKGYTESFYKIVMRAQLVSSTLQKADPNGTTLTPILAKLGKEFPVSVSPRYGTWDATKLSFDGNPAVPAYLKLQSGQG